MNPFSKLANIKNLRFNRSKKRSLLSFSLSEVLITLTIIGSVAAITIPTTVADWQKQACISGLKKMYSTLSNAYTRSLADNGPSNIWDVAESRQNDIIREFFLPYLNIAVDCKDNPRNNKSCVYPFKRYRNTEDYYAKSPVILANGALVAGDYGKFMHTEGGENETISLLRFKILVDINGHKKPNILGRDIFYFYINGVDENNPKLTLKDVFNNPKTREQKIHQCKLDGGGCGSLIMEDGWQIKKDYPW